jgi:hypothetical protein
LALRASAGNGYVSQGRDRGDYGVVLTADGREVDAAATADLREHRNSEGASRWRA